MCVNDSLSGKVELFSEIKGIPDGGLTVRRLRVELFEKPVPDMAWIAEIKILGELPWLEGEGRKV